MSALVPADPLSILGALLLLEFTHLFNEVIVHGPVIFFAKEFWHDVDIIVLDFTTKDWSIWADTDAHIWPNEGRSRVKRLSISTGTTLLLSFALVFRAQQARVVHYLWQIRVQELSLVENLPRRIVFWGFNSLWDRFLHLLVLLQLLTIHV